MLTNNEDEYLSGLAKGTLEKIDGVFDLVVRVLNPDRLRDLRPNGAVEKLAGVKVGTDAKTHIVKFASAHELWRSFGERWAS